MADRQYPTRLWMSAEVVSEVREDLRKLFMAIEKDLNAYLDRIGYKNVLKKWRLVIILRDDDLSDEYVRKERGDDIINFSLKIPYAAFRDGDEKQRKALIYDVILRSLDILEQRKIKHLEVIRDYIEKKKAELG